MTELKPRDPCPDCGIGSLRQTLTQEGEAPSNPNEIRCGQVYKTWWVVGKLACEECDAAFRTSATGKQMERDLIEPQLAGFVNPEKEPTVCPCCGQDEIYRGEKWNPAIVARVMAGPKIPDYPGDIAYRYCVDCLKLVWVFPTIT